MVKALQPPSFRTVIIVINFILIVIIILTTPPAHQQQPVGRPQLLIQLGGIQVVVLELMGQAQAGAAAGGPWGAVMRSGVHGVSDKGSGFRVMRPGMQGGSVKW